MTRERLTWPRSATTLSVGDRDLPLEADLEGDLVREGDKIGDLVEVSPIAGGDLQDLRGKSVKVIGLIRRLGQTVGYQVEYEGKRHLGSGKDFYLDRDLIEDVQPPSATSASIKEALSHWREPRTYWGTRTDGVEALCCQLAAVTPRAKTECFPWGWRLVVPDPRIGCQTVVDCRAFTHGNYWTLAVTVFHEEGVETGYLPPVVPDHWQRAITWTGKIVEGMTQHGFPWVAAYEDLLARSRMTVSTLRPLFRRLLDSCVAANGGTPSFPPGSVSVAVSEVRLKACTIGLVEPPSDRRPYSIVSISPSAFQKDADYLEQVVLHECLHLVVASNGGDPHNSEFNSLARKVGLREEHRE